MSKERIVLKRIEGCEYVQIVKVVKDFAKLDLKTAKDYVDALRDGKEVLLEVENKIEAIRELENIGVVVEFNEEKKVVNKEEIEALGDISKMGRVELLDRLKKISEILVTIGEKIREIDILNSTIEKEKKEAERIGNALSEKMSNIFIICLIVSALSGLLYADRNHIFAMLIFGGLGGWASYGVLNFLDGKEESREKMNEYIKTNIDPLYEKIVQIDSELNEVLNDNITIWAINSLQDQYFDLRVVSDLITYVSCRRADSLKEAINLYEEEKHRNRMEEIQNSILETTEQNLAVSQAQMESLQAIERNTKSAARTAKVNAVINYASYSNIKKIRKRIDR